MFFSFDVVHIAYYEEGKKTGLFATDIARMKVFQICRIFATEIVRFDPKIRMTEKYSSSATKPQKKLGAMNRAPI